MCNVKESKAIHNFNRALVCALSTMGMLMDGLAINDLPYCISLVIWLSLPEVEVIEEKLVKKYKEVVSKR